jgi:hypothetical protein
MIILKSVWYDNVLEITFSYNIMNLFKCYLDIIAKNLRQTPPPKVEMVSYHQYLVWSKKYI